jgi:hypothetical protein
MSEPTDDFAVTAGVLLGGAQALADSTKLLDAKAEFDENDLENLQAASALGLGGSAILSALCHARTTDYLERCAVALERIATALEEKKP